MRMKMRINEKKELRIEHIQHSVLSNKCNKNIYGFKVRISVFISVNFVFLSFNTFELMLSYMHVPTLTTKHNSVSISNEPYLLTSFHEKGKRKEKKKTIPKKWLFISDLVVPFRWQSEAENKLFWWLTWWWLYWYYLEISNSRITFEMW